MNVIAKGSTKDGAVAIKYLDMLDKQGYTAQSVCRNGIFHLEVYGQKTFWYEPPWPGRKQSKSRSAAKTPSPAPPGAKKQRGLFDESKHKRGSKGTSQGGQFVPKGTTGTPTTPKPQEAQQPQITTGVNTKPGSGKTEQTHVPGTEPQEQPVKRTKPKKKGLKPTAAPTFDDPLAVYRNSTGQTREDAISQILASMEGMVRKVAYEYSQKTGVDQEELISAGRLAVTFAADKFDPSRGQAKFSTYATKAIQHAVHRTATREHKKTTSIRNKPDWEKVTAEDKSRHKTKMAVVELIRKHIDRLDDRLRTPLALAYGIDEPGGLGGTKTSRGSKAVGKMLGMGEHKAKALIKEAETQLGQLVRAEALQIKKGEYPDQFAQVMSATTAKTTPPSVAAGQKDTGSALHPTDHAKPKRSGTPNTPVLSTSSVPKVQDRPASMPPLPKPQTGLPKGHPTVQSVMAGISRSAGTHMPKIHNANEAASRVGDEAHVHMRADRAVDSHLRGTSKGIRRYQPEYRRKYESIIDNARQAAHGTLKTEAQQALQRAKSGFESHRKSLNQAIGVANQKASLAAQLRTSNPELSKQLASEADRIAKHVQDHHQMLTAHLSGLEDRISNAEAPGPWVPHWHHGGSRKATPPQPHGSWLSLEGGGTVPEAKRTPAEFKVGGGYTPKKRSYPAYDKMVRDYSASLGISPAAYKDAEEAVWGEKYRHALRYNEARRAAFDKVNAARSTIKKRAGEGDDEDSIANNLDGIIRDLGDEYSDVFGTGEGDDLTAAYRGEKYDQGKIFDIITKPAKRTPSKASEEYHDAIVQWLADQGGKEDDPEREPEDYEKEPFASQFHADLTHAIIDCLARKS